MPGTKRALEKTPDAATESRLPVGEAQREVRESGRAQRAPSHVHQAAGTRTARDSTSINARHRGPIDPRMPQMPPA
jgi:hypothetical protein